MLAKANEAHQKRWRWIVQHVQGMTLDCGSGSGETWKQTGHSMENVVCIDIACYSGVPNFVWGDIHNLPFRDKSFQTVVLSEVLEHVAEPNKVLAEAIRVCRKRLVITVPDEFSWDPAVRPFMTWEDHLKRGELDLIKQIPQLKKDVSEFKFRHHWHIRQFTEAEIEALLNKRNLHVKKFQHYVEDLKPFSHYFIVVEVNEGMGEEEVEAKPLPEEEIAEAPIEEFPNIFVIDQSEPFGSLTGPRRLLVVDEKKCWPMDEAVNTWVREHNIPIKESTVELEEKVADFVGETTIPDLAKLTEKLGE